MARSKHNEVTYGLSGKIGDLLVFRQRHGKTVVARSPRTKGITTDDQKAVQQKFKKAVLYGNAVRANEDLKKIYEAKAVNGLTPYNLAIADFFNAPEIHEIDTSAYSGATGDIIRVLVTDDFIVKTVEVSITGSDNKLIEKGKAVQDVDGEHWTYVTTMPNTALNGTKIIIEVSDLPANMTSAEKVLSQV